MEAPPITHTMALAISRSPHIKKRRMARIILACVAFVIVVFVGMQSVAPKQSAADVTENAAAAAMPTPTEPVVEEPDPAFVGIALGAQSAYVYDIKEKKVLYALNAEAQLPLASLTKVPLALVVSDAMSDDATITVPKRLLTAGDKVNFIAGDQWRLADLRDVTLAASSNDGAEMLAEAANIAVFKKYDNAPAESATLWRMNELAHELGLTNTYFLNVSGLDLSETEAGAYGSARDVAKLFAYAGAEHASLFAATSKSVLTRVSLKGNTVNVENTDEALDSIPDVIMGKTGYTDLVGGNLAVMFNAAPEHPVVIVVMGSTLNGRFEDMKKMVAATQKALSQ